MPLYRCILCAADFSEASREAFRAACSLADETHTRVYVLNVAGPTDPTGGGLGEPAPSREGGWLFDDDTRSLLREAYAPSREIDVTYLVAQGHAAEEILRTAEDVNADLIAVGTHGRSGLRRALAGSVAEAVLRRARCHVLALNSREHRGGGEIRAILHPTDFSERSEPALRVARALARDLGARLILLHVLPMEVVVYGTVPVTLDMQSTRDSLDSLRNGADGPDLKFAVETRLVQGDAAAAILREVEEAGCDMIVMGTHGRTGIGRLLMGSVAEAVLRRSTCPVLAVKTPTVAAEAGHPPAGPAIVVGGEMR